MNNHERRGLDAETADQLLSGSRRPAGFGQLADRLSAASTAAFPGELAGEAAAVAAFRAAADVELVPHDRRSSMMKSAVVAKLLTLKTAVVAVAAVSVGGVALAATTDVLPNPLSPGSPSHSTPAPTHSNGPHATPSPSLVGLCTAYLAGAGQANEHVLDNPAFGALVDAAGGPENVAAFCGERGVTAQPEPHGSRPTDIPSADPSQPATPSHPTGQPTGVPTPSHR